MCLLNQLVNFSISPALSLFLLSFKIILTLCFYKMSAFFSFALIYGSVLSLNSLKMDFIGLLLQQIRSIWLFFAANS